MKKATSIDVANLAGVSQATVSLILNNKNNVSFSPETVERVLNAAKQLNYNVPSSIKNYKKEQSKLIGLITPTIVNPYYPLLTQVIEQTAIDKGYNVLLCNTYRDKDIEKYYLKLLSDKVDGIIYEFSPSFPDLLMDISASLPVVIVGEKDDNINIDTIGLNSYKSGMLVAEHLIKLGHKNIAFVTTPVDNMTLSRRQRLEGVLGKLKEYGLDKNLIIKSATNEYESMTGIYEIEIGYNLTLQLIEESNVTAVIGVNDMTACGIITALQSRGYKIPDQISVCGFDNVFVSSILNPSLTTIDHCINHRGRTAVDILMEKIDGKNRDLSLMKPSHQNVYKIEYEPQLIIRNSTGPIKNR